MARDLYREVGRQPRNGSESVRAAEAILTPEPAEPLSEESAETPRVEIPEPPDPVVRATARRDKLLARIAVVLLDGARILDPITRIVMARVLALASLGAAVGITVYTIGKTEGWQRVAIAGLFLVLTALLIRKGQL